MSVSSSKKFRVLRKPSLAQPLLTWQPRSLELQTSTLSAFHTGIEEKLWRPVAMVQQTHAGSSVPLRAMGRSFWHRKALDGQELACFCNSNVWPQIH
jgi:hypothetical protein